MNKIKNNIIGALVIAMVTCIYIAGFMILTFLDAAQVIKEAFYDGRN